MIGLDERRSRVAELFAKVEDAPREWFSAAAAATNGRAHYGVVSEAVPCATWAECEAAWVDAMFWRRDLSDAMAVMLAICASTNQSGNQLFLDLIGSPGSAKTTMCQGLLASAQCIRVENMTKIVSGWKKPDDEGADCSFLARANNKTWVTCEFDVLGSSPEYHQLMGKIRRIFDGETSTTYGNDDKDRIYTGLRTPWIRAGTPKMMDRMADYDQSALGDRFLRFILSDPEQSEKRDILRSVVRSERSAMLGSANGTSGSLVDSKTRAAHALTGGYVDWLRARAEEVLGVVEVPLEAEDYCIDLAELSADLRARPNEDRWKVEANEFKELPTRLARQNIRLASHLAVVLNKPSVDAEVMRIVRKVALDTAAGHSLNMVRWLCLPNPKAANKLYQECGGMMMATLEGWSGMVPDRLHRHLKFLQKIGVLDMRSNKGMANSWVLTDRVYELYLRIDGGMRCL